MRALLAAMVLAFCSAPAVAQQQKSLFVGKVETAKMLGLINDFRPAGENETWHGEVYELKLRVLEVLSGADPGKDVTVRVTAHARQFKGMTIAVMLDPEWPGFAPGASWWTSIRSLVCLPTDLLKDEAWEKFVEDSHPWDDERCLEQ